VIPAIKITVEILTPFHTSTPITENRARFVSPSQFGPLIPIAPSAVFNNPFVGCIKALKVIPIAIALTRFGKNTSERRKVFDFILLVRNNAIKNAMITLSALVKKAYIRVFLTDILSERSEKKVTKLSSPQNVNVFRSHTVKLKNSDDTIGIMKKTRNIISAGTRNHVE
jgi:hypothetical protein